jgi:hypothetical protein
VAEKTGGPAWVNGSKGLIFRQNAPEGSESYVIGRFFVIWYWLTNPDERGLPVAHFEESWHP